MANHLRLHATRASRRGGGGEADGLYPHLRQAGLRQAFIDDAMQFREMLLKSEVVLHFDFPWVAGRLAASTFREPVRLVPPSS